VFSNVTAAHSFLSACQAVKKRVMSKLLPTDGNDPSVSSAAPPHPITALCYCCYLACRIVQASSHQIKYSASSDISVLRSKPQIDFGFGRRRFRIMAGQLSCTFSQSLGYGLDDPGFESQQGQEIFHFSKTSRSALDPVFG
jgi:hypothetical protein